MEITAISESLKRQLLKVEPSKDWIIEYRPCEVTLKNGKQLDRVYIVESDSYLKAWGIMPDQDKGKNFVLVEDIEEIRESSLRMPAKLANKLYKAGESGMGYCLYKMTLDNGESIDVVAGNAIDFPPLPQGIRSNNIKDVFPHQGSRQNPTKSPNYIWCIYKEKV